MVVAGVGIVGYSLYKSPREQQSGTSVQVHKPKPWFHIGHQGVHLPFIHIDGDGVEVGPIVIGHDGINFVVAGDANASTVSVGGNSLFDHAGSATAVVGHVHSAPEQQVQHVSREPQKQPWIAGLTVMEKENKWNKGSCTSHVFMGGMMVPIIKDGLVVDFIPSPSSTIILPGDGRTSEQFVCGNTTFECSKLVVETGPTSSAKPVIKFVGPPGNPLGDKERSFDELRKPGWWKQMTELVTTTSSMVPSTVVLRPVNPTRSLSVNGKNYTHGCESIQVTTVKHE